MEQYLSPNDPRFAAESDSETIQNAVNAAASGDIRTVRIPRVCARTGRPEWLIDRAILLPSDITVVLDDCHLVLKQGIYDNIFRNANMYTEISTKAEGRQHGIRIIGFGDAILDGGLGNDLNEWTSGKDGRPSVRYNHFVELHNVTDYVLENFSCVNLRHWAICQICCTHGRLENLRFLNGPTQPNLDGIDVRLGCSHLYINNITGRLSDDVVALTALAGYREREVFLVEGMEPDIHDVTIRNVFADTKYSLVALRNTDGAKMYRIFIENIADPGGIYGPRSVVRIGENLYYKQRTAILGETYDIHVRGVYSRSHGTIFIGAALKDSHISDVYAGGTAMHAISTFAVSKYLEKQKCHVHGGATMENVVFENIHYNGKPAHMDDEWMCHPHETDYRGRALDLRCMQEEHFLRRVVFRDVFACEGADICVADEGVNPDIRN